MVHIDDIDANPLGYFRNSLPSIFGRFRRVLEHATTEANGTILLPQTSWMSEDPAFLHGLIAEYEQLMGAAGLANAHSAAPGLGEFKKMPVYGRSGDSALEKRVNSLLHTQLGVFPINDYLLALRRYHRSIQKKRLMCKGDARISVGQLNKLCALDLHVIFPPGYDLWSAPPPDSISSTAGEHGAKDECNNNSVFTFWMPEERNGWCSNWYHSPFTSPDGTAFTSVEQWIMYKKAVLFGDTESANEILAAGHDPCRQKAIGRKVQGFVEETWLSERAEVLYQGLKLKFDQDAALAEKLMSTVGSRLAEVESYCLSAL